MLPSGAIHPDLVKRLAEEAAKSAQHVLDMCIRALDYVPPVDITFGEYLRGLITADADLVADDRYNYRVAFVEAFRRRGLYPDDLNVLSVDALRWRGMDPDDVPASYAALLRPLKRYADACSYTSDRASLFARTKKACADLKKALTKIFAASPEFASELGLDAAGDFEVHELRRAMRVNSRGRSVPQAIVAVTQASELAVDASPTPHVFRGGCTVIVDLAAPAISYLIVKRIDARGRRQRQTEFLDQALADPLQALLLLPNQDEPFAALHLLGDIAGF